MKKGAALPKTEKSNGKILLSEENFGHSIIIPELLSGQLKLQRHRDLMQKCLQTGESQHNDGRMKDEISPENL